MEIVFNIRLTSEQDKEDILAYLDMTEKEWEERKEELVAMVEKDLKTEESEAVEIDIKLQEKGSR